MTQARDPFRYSPEEVEAILRTLPRSISNEDLCYVLGQMEDGSCLYVGIATLEKTSSRADTDGLIESVESLSNHLDAVVGNWGIANLGLTDARYENLRQYLLEIYTAARSLSSAHEIPSSFRKTRKEKFARRALVERAYSLWIALHEPVAVPKKVPTEMLDFIWAAVTPVLSSGDRFNDSEKSAGRDALGKVVDAIRRDGAKYLGFVQIMNEDRLRGNS